MLFASRFGPPIDRIETAAENTGLAHVWPNKGGLLAKLEASKPRMLDTPFSVAQSESTFSPFGFPTLAHF